MVFEKVRAVIAEQSGKEEDSIKMETTFEELAIDSLDLFQMLMDLEDAFNVHVDNTDDLKTVGDIVRAMEGGNA